jgi:hypothetical protein
MGVPFFRLYATISAMAEPNSSAMKDWHKISDGLASGIPTAQIDTIRPTLDALEKLFRPLAATLTPEDDTATPFSSPESMAE